MVEELIEHFQYISVQTEVKKLPDIEKIKDEIDSYRPCMLYLEKTTGGGHAVVIDGWRMRREFEVHLNMGWKGKNNSWYVYDEPILDYDNNSVRTIIFIRIAPNKPQKPIGPLTGAPGVEYDFTTTTESALDYTIQGRQVNSFVGGRDVAFFGGTIGVTLDKGDQLLLKVMNNSGTANITAEGFSFIRVQER